MINALNILLTDNLSTTYFYTPLWLHPFVAHFKPGGLVDLKETATLSNSLILHRIFQNMGRTLYASYREVLYIWIFALHEEKPSFKDVRACS